MIARNTAIVMFLLVHCGLAPTAAQASVQDGRFCAAGLVRPAATSNVVAAKASDQNARALLRRIRTVAQAACGAEPSDTLDAAARYRVCMRVTVDNLVAAQGNQQLTVLNRLPPPELLATERRLPAS